MSGGPGLFDGALYAANTAHHRAYDDAVLARVPLAPGTDVLDLGCGSGDFTARLVPLVAPGRVVGVDVSPSQVAHARAHHPGARFVAGRAQDVATLFAAASFDVVVSVATLRPEEAFSTSARTGRSRPSASAMRSASAVASSPAA